MYNLRLMFIHHNADNVESPGLIDFLHFYVSLCACSQSYLTLLIYRIFRISIAIGASCLDFCKHDDFIVFCNDIGLQIANTPIALEDGISLPLEQFSGHIFAFTA